MSHLNFAAPTSVYSTVSFNIITVIESKMADGKRARGMQTESRLSNKQTDFIYIGLINQLFLKFQVGYGILL